MTSKPLPEGALEEGRIFFFYRPRVAMDHPHSVDDVQRFYMIMSPVSGPDAPHRLLIVGKKRLPEKRERFFGFVEAVSDQMEKLTEEFGLKERETKTRGKRVTQPARVAGEGAYTLAEHGGNVVLAYKLEAPEQPGEVQDELGIKQESSLVISVKNPTIGSPPNAGLEHKAKYSEKQMQEFGDYNWIPVRDPSLLDVPHAEFLLILARAGAKDVKGEIGQAAEHMEQAAKEDVEHFKEEHPDDDAHTALIEKLRSETRAEKPHMPVEPAVEGKWE
ncbi:hypothetical protein WJX72_005493 [[Myrmecia] bisecta]|uniref:Uncharacterized protein n=1 Tax=[Myrmecia] bisecta TaxID=41462 RepID=A0AAW1R7Q7_9CHLO